MSTTQARTIRFDETQHRYWLGDTELTSVSRVLSVWPQDECKTCGRLMFGKHEPGCKVADNIEHAKHRGIRVDRYATEFLRTGKCVVKAGEWTEVVNLLKKLIPWLEKKKFTPQVILHDEAIAGTCDFLAADAIADLKCTYDVSFRHCLQLGAYADLSSHSLHRLPGRLEIIHVTERFKEPQIIQYDVAECVNNWRTVKAMWALHRRAA